VTGEYCKAAIVAFLLFLSHKLTLVRHHSDGQMRENVTDE
jgi:hypothetical protein